jgi:hypothetical protein
MVTDLSYVSPYRVARGSTASVIARSRRPTISSVIASLGSDWTLSLRAPAGVPGPTRTRQDSAQSSQTGDGEARSSG